MNSYLHVENVYKSYGSLIVLDNIDLGVDEGSFCTVVGPSGCGKSTLLRLILGSEQPDRGGLTIEGAPISTPDPRRGIVFQRYSLYPHLTVLDNVMLGPRMLAGAFCSKNRKHEIEEQAHEILGRVRLRGHEKKYPHELSGGMQQRVAIAQSLIMRPKVLLMDEPFGALDPDTREDQQLFLLEQWEETGTTIFFVTHDLEEAAFLGTRLLALSRYYTDDRGHDSPTRGAKVVYDIELSRSALASSVKREQDFQELIADIRLRAFDPETLQHAREFNLHHPKSYQTLTAEEARID